jgi:hypothetical protein
MAIHLVVDNTRDGTPGEAVEDSERVLTYRCLSKLANLSAYDADSQHYVARTMLILMLLDAVARFELGGSRHAKDARQACLPRGDARRPVADAG